MTSVQTPTPEASEQPVPAPDELTSSLVLASLAAAAAVVSATGSLVLPDVLRGAPVTDGNLRGTALVVLVVGVPLVVVAAWATYRGSVRAVGAWLAGLLYLAYQGVMFCFGTPMNRLFPAYVAMLGLSGWAVAVLLRRVDARAVIARSAVLPRWVLWCLGTLAVLNAAAWLARALPILWTGTVPASVAESGLDTSPVLVQDLAFWLPLALVVAVQAARRRPWAVLMAPALLLFWAVEALSVASDQWWGVRADDGHPAVASMTAVPGGLVLAVALGVAWTVATRPPPRG